MQKILEIKNGIARNEAHRLQFPVNFVLRAGESVAISGPNGGGKSLLTGLITGAIPIKTVLPDGQTGERHTGKGAIRSIVFNDVYGTTPPAYYQQRWNHGDDMTFPTVCETLEKSRRDAAEAPRVLSSQTMNNIEKALNIPPLLNKKVNQLSSGELRRLQLMRILQACPSVLVIDNPYIGLDPNSRAVLTAVLQQLSQFISLILVVCRPLEIPSFINRVIHVENKQMRERTRETEIQESKQSEETEQPAAAIPAPTTRDYPETEAGEEIVSLSDINISYGTRIVFKNFSCNIKSGEHWAVTGPNGAGKTTLLSLMLADNPIAYALPVRLFGRKRGSGESIWDIKRKIGYVSPEIFSTYKKHLSVIHILASGLHDTIGIYRTHSNAETIVCQQWLATFGVPHLAEKCYLELSHGEQRLVLLIRAFVKSPQLLILDEPFHGLDRHWCEKAKEITDRYMAANPRRTLIMVTHHTEELPACIDHHLRISPPDK